MEFNTPRCQKLNFFVVEIKAKYEKKMKLLAQELDNLRGTAISETEGQWSGHINRLKEDHDTFFSEQGKVRVKSTQQDLDMNQSLMVRAHILHPEKLCWCCF